MPVDLERAFEDLRTHTRTVVLPPAGELRRRGDRRRRTRMATALVTAAAAVAVITISVGVPGLLGAGRSVAPAATPPVPSTAPVQPTPTVINTPTAQPTPQPTERELDQVHIDFPPGCPVPDETLPISPRATSGDALPTSIMLEAGDWGRCYGIYADDAGYEVYSPGLAHPAPALCPGFRPYPADEHRVAGRVREVYGGPEVYGTQRVTQYAPGQARAFMDQVRQAASDCPDASQDGPPMHVRILDTAFAGDESMILFIGGQPETPDDSYPGLFQAVVRIGDIVTIVYPSFDLSGDRAYTIEMALKAAARLS